MRNAHELQHQLENLESLLPCSNPSSFTFVWNEEINFLLARSSRLLEVALPFSNSCAAHKGNEIEKLIADLWMLWEKRRKIVSSVALQFSFQFLCVLNIEPSRFASAETAQLSFPKIKYHPQKKKIFLNFLLFLRLRHMNNDKVVVKWWWRWFRVQASGSVTYVTRSSSHEIFLTETTTRFVLLIVVEHENLQTWN